MSIAGYGIHFGDNLYSQAEQARHFARLERWQPPWINIIGGAQRNEALAFALDVRRRFPQINVIFRHWQGEHGDNGMVVRMPPAQWMSEIGTQYVGLGLYVLPDNESGGRWPDYVAWHSELMDIAGSIGLGLAVARTSTHNPPLDVIDAQYPLLLRKLADWRGVHVWSPNLYFDSRPAHLNDDGWRVIRRAFALCQALEIPTPRTVIGEFAYAENLDPHAGYRGRISDAVYFEALRARYERWLKPYEVHACLYIKGQWHGFDLSEEIENMLTEHAEQQRAEASAPGPMDVNHPGWRSGIVKSIRDGLTFVNVRSSPEVVASNIIGRIGLGDVGKRVQFIQNPHGDQPQYVKWDAVRMAQSDGWERDANGYVHEDYAALDTAQEPPPPPPPPDTVEARLAALEAENASLRSALMTLLKMQHAGVETTLRFYQEQAGPQQSIAAHYVQQQGAYQAALVQLNILITDLG